MANKLMDNLIKFSKAASKIYLMSLNVHYRNAHKNSMVFCVDVVFTSLVLRNSYNKYGIICVISISHSSSHGALFLCLSFVFVNFPQHIRRTFLRKRRQTRRIQTRYGDVYTQRAHMDVCVHMKRTTRFRDGKFQVSANETDRSTSNSLTFLLKCYPIQNRRADCMPERAERTMKR